MCKSSVEYAELAGLRYALLNLKYPTKPDTQVIIDWMEARIRELESK